jgi:hypothetical protein
MMLDPVTAAALAWAGIQLQTPADPAVISQDAAQRAALAAMPASAVRETALADFTDTHRVPAVSTLARAVSLTVPSGTHPASARPRPGNRRPGPSFLVVFIDARTGAFIQATSRGRP